MGLDQLLVLNNFKGKIIQVDEHRAHGTLSRLSLIILGNEEKHTVLTNSEILGSFLGKDIEINRDIICTGLDQLRVEQSVKYMRNGNIYTLKETIHYPR